MAADLFALLNTESMYHARARLATGIQDGSQAAMVDGVALTESCGIIKAIGRKLVLKSREDT